jgi:chaperonin cofactor prefoldin
MFLAMRKDSIDKLAVEKAFLIFAERGHQIVDYSHKPTDYARGTVLEPDNVSKLRVNFGEYETLGNRCKEICSEIESLQDKMKVTRSRGNFQVLQNQMKMVSNLMKEKSAIDAKMAVIDLARKKTDDHKLAVGEEPSYAEKIDSVTARIAELEAKISNFAE